MSSHVHEHEVAVLPSPLHYKRNGRVQHAFMASLPPGVFEQKVLNLVIDQDADVKIFTDECVQFRLGKKSLLRRNYRGDNLPIDVTLTMHRETLCLKSMTHVEVVISPRVRARDEVLKQRCSQLVNDIHACFLGHPLEKLN